MRVAAVVATCVAVVGAYGGWMTGAVVALMVALVCSRLEHRLL